MTKQEKILKRALIMAASKAHGKRSRKCIKNCTLPCGEVDCSDPEEIANHYINLAKEPICHK